MDLMLIGAKTAEEICTKNEELVQLLGIVKNVLTIIQIAVPILLIIMGSIDLMKAVMAGKEDEIKKSQNTFIKRAIAAVIVFFIPMIVSIVMGLISVGEDGPGGQNVNYNDCWKLT